MNIPGINMTIVSNPVSWVTIGIMGIFGILAIVLIFQQVENQIEGN